MANIRVPSNVSSITFSVSGVKVPAAGIVSGITADEATQTCSPYQKGPGNLGVASSNITTGAVDILVPSTISSITIGGNVRVPGPSSGNWGICAAVPAAAAADFFLGMSRRDSMFELVVG